MSIIKKTLLTVVVFTTVIIVSFYFIITTLNDNDYRKVIIWSAPFITGHDLEINGNFFIDVSMEPVISASKVNIRSLSRPYKVYIETIDLQFAILPLFSDILNIKYLNISDVNISSNELEEDLPQTDRTKSFDLLPILELADVRNIRYTHERSDTLPPVEIYLEKLLLKEAYPDGSRVLKGAGRIGTDEFILNGEMGSLAELFEPTQPFPMMLTWELPGGAIRVEGTIRHPWTGQAVNLAISSDIHDVDYLLSRIYPDVPDLGYLRFSGKLTGDYPVFGLESVQLGLKRDDAVIINATGRIEDFRNMVGLDIQYDVTINDSAIINRYLPEGSPYIQQFTTKGHIQSNESEFLIKEAKLQMANNEGLDIHAEGYMDLIDFLNELPLDNTEINATIISPTTHALGPLLTEKMPELGPVTGQVHLIASDGSFSADELNIDFGTGNTLVGSIKGEIGKINFEIENPLTDVYLDISVDSDNTASIANIIDFKLPELGPLSARMYLNLKNKIAALIIKDIHTDKNEQLSVKADGKFLLGEIFTDTIVDEFYLNFNLTSHSTAFLSGLMEYEIPDIGPIDARFRLHGDTENITIEDIKLVAGKVDIVKVELEGHIDEFQSMREFGSTDMIGSIHANSLTGLSSITIKTLPAAGPVQGNFSVRGNSKTLTVPEFSVSVGDENSFRLDGKGEVQQISLSPNLKIAGANIPLELHTQTTEQFAGLIGETLPELGPLVLKAVLIDHEDNPRLQDIDLQIGDVKQPVLKSSGQLDYFLNTDNMNLESRFETDISLLLSRVTEQDIPDLGKITGNMKLNDSDGTLDFEILEMSGSKAGIYSFSAKGVYDETKRHGIVLDTQLYFDDLDRFEGYWEQDLPITGPIDLKGHLSVSNEDVNFNGDINFLEGIFTVDLDGILTGERPKITGKIFTPELKIEKVINFYNQHPDRSASINNETSSPDKTISTSQGDSTNIYEQRKQIPDNQEAESKQLTPLFNKERVNLDALNLLDLDLQITIDEMTGSGSKIDKIDTRIKLDDGKLRIHPADVFYEGGYVQADVNLIAANPAQVSLKLMAEDVNLEQLASRFEENKTIDGDLHLNIDLTSKGNSQHEIVSNLNGKFGWVVENGKIYTNALDILHLDVMKWFLGGILGNQEREITCAISHYTIKDGLMTSDIFYFGTTTDEFRAKGTVYLPNEELDLVLYASQKKLLGSGKKSYKIGGTMREPEIKGVPFIQAIAQYGTIIFTPVLFLPSAAMGSLWSMVDKDAGSTCVETRVEAEKKRNESLDQLN